MSIASCTQIGAVDAGSKDEDVSRTSPETVTAGARATLSVVSMKYACQMSGRGFLGDGRRHGPEGQSRAPHEIDRKARFDYGGYVLVGVPTNASVEALIQDRFRLRL